MRTQRLFSQLFLIGSICCILFASGCASVPITGRSQVRLVSTSDLVQTSFQSYEEIVQQSPVSRDRSDNAMLNRVGSRLSKATEGLLVELEREDELKYYQWQYTLIEDDSTINAFCMPGGKIVVYTGILPIAQDETGLAVVVGHEIAHAVANHGNERVSQMMLAEFGAQTLAAALSKQPARTQQLFNTAYGLGAQYGVLLPYSRVHEREADRLGLIIMAKAGYDPRAAIPFWERMASSGGADIPEFLSTHPATDNRIEAIRSNIPEAMKYYNKQ